MASRENPLLVDAKFARILGEERIHEHEIGARAGEVPFVHPAVVLRQPGGVDENRALVGGCLDVHVAAQLLASAAAAVETEDERIRLGRIVRLRHGHQIFAIHPGDHDGASRGLHRRAPIAHLLRDVGARPGLAAAARSRVGAARSAGPAAARGARAAGCAGSAGAAVFTAGSRLATRAADPSAAGCAAGSRLAAGAPARATAPRLPTGATSRRTAAAALAAAGSASASGRRTTAAALAAAGSAGASRGGSTVATLAGARRGSAIAPAATADVTCAATQREEHRARDEPGRGGRRE
jgi:hypothetical protein